MIIMEIIVNSHNFCVKIKHIEARKLCYQFSKGFIEYDFIRQGSQFVRTPKKVFATSNRSHSEFRFLASSLKDFLELLRLQGLREGKDYTITTSSLYTAAPAVFKVHEKWTDLPEQLPVLDHLRVTQPVVKPSKLLVTLQTGKGKTYTALKEISQRAHRWINVCKPAYMEKWYEDIKKTYDLDMNRVLMVAGGKSLKALIQLHEDDSWDVAIVSTKTLLNWIKEYEELGADSLSLGYDCLPPEFFERLKVGTRLNDEAHMELHFQIKLDCYTHVLNSIGLSATYASDNPFIERMMKTAYPTDTRLKNLKLDKYADAFAVYYRIGDNQWLRTQEHGSNNYSHIAFEKSILKNTRWRKNYFKLIGDLVENTYIPLKREKKVAAVFASSVEMCSQLRAYLQDRFPKQIVKRYVQDDPVEHIYSCDILVTTVLSAGTAIDIPDLTSVYLTIAISSTQANIQTFGRLRKLADHKTEFYYLTCTDVAKHMEYDVNKRKMLKERAKSTHDYHTGVIL